MTKLNDKGQALMELYEAYNNTSTPAAVRKATYESMVKLANKSIIEVVDSGVPVKKFEKLLKEHYAFIECKFDEKDFAVDILKDFNVALEVRRIGGMLYGGVIVERHVMCRLTDLERIFGISKFEAKCWYNQGITKSIVKSLYHKTCNATIDEYRAVLPKEVSVTTRYGENTDRHMCFITIAVSIKTDNLSVENINRIGRFMQQLEHISTEITL